MALAVFHKQLYKNRNIFKRGIGKIRIVLIELPIELPIALPIVLPIVLPIEICPYWSEKLRYHELPWGTMHYDNFGMTQWRNDTVTE